MEFATGCFLLIRTSVFQKLEGFDPRFFLYQEDSDLSRRVLEQNLGSIVYHPDMTVTHRWARENTRTFRAGCGRSVPSANISEMGDHLVKTTVLLAAYQGEKSFFPPSWIPCPQTDPDFHRLFQDDGSTDRTPQILGDWAEKDARFHAACEQGRHFGAIGNFFSLLRQADGSDPLLCDQDDIWEPGKAGRLEQAIRKRRFIRAR